MRENDCEAQLTIVRSWLSDENYAATKGLVEDYFRSGFQGVRFDMLAAQTPHDEIGKKDLSAVRALSIGFPRSFVENLEREDVRRHIREILAEIPANKAVEDLTCAEFERWLGRDSVAWRTWEELAKCLKMANARAPYVGASKLLAAKRLRLIPLEDSFVRRALHTRRRDIWKVIHHIVCDPKIRECLERIRQEVPAASHLTIHRLLDIIAWRTGQRR